MTTVIGMNPETAQVNLMRLGVRRGIPDCLPVCFSRELMSAVTQWVCVIQVIPELKLTQYGHNGPPYFNSNLIPLW